MLSQRESVLPTKLIESVRAEEAARRQRLAALVGTTPRLQRAKEEHAEQQARLKAYAGSLRPKCFAK